MRSFQLLLGRVCNINHISDKAVTFDIKDSVLDQHGNEVPRYHKVLAENAWAKLIKEQLWERDLCCVEGDWPKDKTALIRLNKISIMQKARGGKAEVVKS
jgi:hypothetical protein